MRTRPHCRSSVRILLALCIPLAGCSSAGSLALSQQQVTTNANDIRELHKYIADLDSRIDQRAYDSKVAQLEARVAALQSSIDSSQRAGDVRALLDELTQTTKQDIRSVEEERTEIAALQNRLSSLSGQDLQHETLTKELLENRVEILKLESLVGNLNVLVSSLPKPTPQPSATPEPAPGNSATPGTVQKPPCKALRNWLVFSLLGVAGFVALMLAIALAANVDTPHQRWVRLRRLSFIFKFRFCVSAILLASGLGFADPFVSYFGGTLSNGWRFALFMSGFVLALHLTISSRIVHLNSLNPEGHLREARKSLFQSAFDSSRDIVNWLITASGVIIGLVAKNSMSSSLEKAAVGSLGLCIILGILHADFYGSGIVHDDPSKRTLLMNGPNFRLARFLLNAMWICFLIGITGLIGTILP